MVLLKEIENTLWGAKVDGKKEYEHKSDKPVHISMASLDTSEKFDQYVPLMIQQGNESYIICTLHAPSVLQQNLNLELNKGETVKFTVKGNGVVHLTGYYIMEMDDENFPHPNFDQFEEEEDDDEGTEDGEAFLNAILPKKRRLKGNNDHIHSKKCKHEEDDDEDDYENDEDEKDDDSEENIDQDDGDDDNDDGDEDDNGDEDDDDSEDDDDEEDEDDEQEEEQPPKLVRRQENKSKNGDQSGNQARNVEGVLIKDIKVGTGREAKKGKFVHVYYQGRLKQNGKTFDSCLSGKPFKFRLGNGDVIKGWEIGVDGMKVGGKRQLTISPKMAYGNQKLDGIPANSTLVFDVELKSVN